MLLARVALVASLISPALAAAQRDSSRDALSRVEESLEIRLEEGGFQLAQVTPAIVVSVTPAFEESRTWYPTAALSTLVRVFGGASLRSCEACMGPRVFVENGHLEQNSTGLTAVEIIRFDEANRGNAPPARVAIWLDENASGVSLKVIDLQNSRLILAENFDPSLDESTRTRKAFSTARSLERRARGDSIVHTFIDLTMYPGPRLTMDWTEQWGDTNENLAGLTLSVFDPVLGVGLSYYRILPNALNISVGGQVIMSVPTAIVQVVSGNNQTVLDPLLTAAFVVRWPIFNSNYAVIASASTNLQFGIGISLMNFTLLPVVP